ncbi:MAG: hypothetical protein ACP5D2_02260 [Candidatus Nanoarchaeia archaeon]
MTSYNPQDIEGQASSQDRRDAYEPPRTYKPGQKPTNRRDIPRLSRDLGWKLGDWD